MPSRQIPPPPQPQPPSSQSPYPLAGGVTAAFSLLILLTLCFPKLARKPRTVPSNSNSKPPPHRFPYSSLRRATSSFSPSLLLGQGGFGSVYRGNLTNPTRAVAVKVMDTGSLQGEREFQNELSLCSKFDSDHVISLLGFSSDRKRRRMCLVFEIMSNGSLQDRLLRRKSPELREWRKRFEIAIDVAKGLEYLHHCCDPPIIHGDIKPSNILLDCNFTAKIGDFGLARLKSENQCEIDIGNGGLGEGKELEVNGGAGAEDRAETATTTTRQTGDSGEKLERDSVSEGDFDRASEESRRKRRLKRDNGGGAESGVVKDYVREWIGNEIRDERPKNEWVGASSSLGKSERKKNRKEVEWWKTMEGEKKAKREKRRPAREWWKEEYCEELARKKKKKNKKQGSISDGNDGENWWPVDEDLYTDGKKKKKSRSRSRSRSRGSRGSIDWLMDKLSVNSHDSDSEGTPKSVGGYSSTPSMRGTVCYNAPENGGGGENSEKCDVYSYGVLMLVLVAGRRPLLLTSSPKPEYKRANLLSWARHLARGGKLLDLVDKSVQSLDQEQALLCITIALLCLQKLPARRPSMKEVVGMLSGELECPQLPVEFSPSPPSRVPLKSRKNAR